MTETVHATTTADAADQALKARHRAIWASGDYAAVAREVIADLGPELVRTCRVAPRDHVLDLAAGTGNVAIPAARTGATVVASDLTPELLDVGRRLAADQLTTDQSVRVWWEQGDAEQLPYDDSSFDVVLSCVGVMFAPHHQAAADELVRVCRPGGRIGLISWTPTGFVGQLFAALKPFNPPPPPGVQSPPLWGDPDHVGALLGRRVTDLRFERRRLHVERFARPEEFRAFFGQAYGPTVAAYRNNAGDPARVAALDAALDEVAARFHTDGAMEWEYLLLTARRR